MKEPLTILVAARDEEATIGETVELLRARFPQAEVLVADDGSRDRTAERAEAAGATVLPLRRLGKGQALSSAERAAPPGRLLLCDADLRGDLRPLLAGDADVNVAIFRERVGGGFGLAKSVARGLIRVLSGFEAVEPLSGQRALSSRARAAVFPLAPGFGCETRMTIDAARAGLRVEEVELDLEHRATGRDARGFLHRGRQLVDLALGSGPLAVNFRGRRLPLVGWLVGVRADPAVAAVAAIGLADDLWSGEERGFRAHLARGADDGRAEARRDPARGTARDEEGVGRDARRARREHAQPARHSAGTSAQGVSRRRGDRSTARHRRPAADLRSSRDGHARGRGVKCAWVDARLAFRESSHGTRPVDRDRRPCRPHHLRRASFPR